MLRDEPNDPVLCYVDGLWAWFTTSPLADQWGDDWNDAPYEHNAGDPYAWREYMADRGTLRYELTKVAWDGPLETPCEHHLNSPYSVQQINAGAVAWLVTPRWHTGDPVAIPAGVGLPEFKRLVAAAGGRVYEEVCRMPSDNPTNLAVQADAIQLVAQLIQPVREVRGEDDLIHPHMPEDDAALVRHIRAMIDRGDHLADTIRWAREALNEMCRKWMEGEQSADEALTEFFEQDGMPSRTPVYEWQKARERTAFIAKHRHAAAYQEARRA